LRFWCWISVVLWGLAGQAAWAGAPPLSLSEAILVALKENPGLRAAGLEVPAAEADIARARARFLPRLDATETYGYSDSPSQVFMSKLNQRRFTQDDFRLNNLNEPTPYGNFRTGLALSQPLFQAGEAYLGYQQARLRRDMAAAQVVGRRQELVFQVTRAYFGLQLAREKLRVVGRAVKTARLHQDLVQSRFQEGAVIKSDVLSAQVHLAKLRQEELTAASQVKIAQSALNTAMGKPVAASRPLSPAPREPAPLPGGLEDLQKVAQENRPDLKHLEIAAQVAQKEYAKARYNYLPRAQVVVEYDVDQRNLFGSSADSFTVLALLNFNLFNGLADLARVRETRAKEAQARELRRELVDRVRHQVTEAVLNLRTAHERYQVAQSAVAEAQESLRLIRLRYGEGLTILVDLLTAEDATKEAELNQQAALFDTHIAQTGLELALGTLTGPPATESVTKKP
jgi:outer membrane protein